MLEWFQYINLNIVIAIQSCSILSVCSNFSRACNTVRQPILFSETNRFFYYLVDTGLFEGVETVVDSRNIAPAEYLFESIHHRKSFIVILTGIKMNQSSPTADAIIVDNSFLKPSASKTSTNIISLTTKKPMNPTRLCVFLSFL